MRKWITRLQPIALVAVILTTSVSHASNGGKHDRKAASDAIQKTLDIYQGWQEILDTGDSTERTVGEGDASRSIVEAKQNLNVPSNEMLTEVLPYAADDASIETIFVQSTIAREHLTAAEEILVDFPPDYDSNVSDGIQPSFEDDALKNRALDVMTRIMLAQMHTADMGDKREANTTFNEQETGVPHAQIIKLARESAGDYTPPEKKQNSGPKPWEGLVQGPLVQHTAKSPVQRTPHEQLEQIARHRAENHLRAARIYRRP